MVFLKLLLMLLPLPSGSHGSELTSKVGGVLLGELESPDSIMTGVGSS